MAHRAQNGLGGLEWPKMAQNCPEGPKWPRGPKMAQNGPEGPKWPRVPRMAQNGPEGPKWSRGPRMVQNSPEGPKWLMGPNMAQGAQNCSDGPEIIKESENLKISETQFFLGHPVEYPIPLSACLSACLSRKRCHVFRAEGPIDRGAAKF